MRQFSPDIWQRDRQYTEMTYCIAEHGARVDDDMSTFGATDSQSVRQLYICMISACQ
jgi:hypothetical protein